MAGDAVGDARLRGAVRLRLLDQPHQLRQPGGGADVGDAHARRTRAADRAGVDRRAGGFVDGVGLAGQQRLGERGVAIQQHAVGGHRVAGGDAGDVIDRQRRYRHGLARAVLAFARRQRRPRPRQRVDLGVGGVARALLQHPRRQQQEHEHHRGVVPHVRSAAQRLDHAGEIRQQRRGGDQRVHAEAAMAQLAPGPGDERPAGVEHHRRRHQERDPAEEVARRQRHLPAGVEVQRLGEHHRLHRAQAGQPQPQQVAVARGAALALAALTAGQVRPEAERHEDLQHRRQRRGLRVPGEADAPGHRVRRHLHHARCP